jgi:hypothetical protein
MKKVVIVVGGLFILLLGGFLGQAINVNALSKVELEELVQEQQTTIDNLSLQLAEVTKRLEALDSKESNTEKIDSRLSKVETIIGEWDDERSVIRLIYDLDSSFNKRVSLLEKINKVDAASIQEYINNLPQHISNEIWRTVYYDSNNGCGYSPYPNQNNCTYPIEKDSLTFYNVGSNNYDIFNYISEEEFKKLVIDAYNENKSDKVIYKNIKVYVTQPFNLTYKIIEIPLQ